MYFSRLEDNLIIRNRDKLSELISDKHIEDSIGNQYFESDNYINTAVKQYVNKLDRLIFDNLSSDYKYIHIESYQISENIYNGYAITSRIVPSDKENIFEKEERIDLQEIRTMLYEYQIDYKNMKYDEFIRLTRRIL